MKIMTRVFCRQTYPVCAKVTLFVYLVVTWYEAVRAQSSTLTAQDVYEKRLAEANLSEHLLNLSIVKHKTPPAPTVTSDPNLPLIDVDVRFFLQTIIGIDDTQQILSSRQLITVDWLDEALKWNESEYSGVDSLTVPVDSMWTPGISLINSLDSGIIMHDVRDLTVSSDGSVSAETITTVTTMCSMNYAQFPYDTQYCSLILQSSEPSVKINLGYITLGDSYSETFAKKSEWELIKMTSDAQPPRPGRTIGLPYIKMELRRRTTYYTLCLVLPMVITSYMNTLVFLIPLQAGEKISFVVTVFVSSSVYVSFFKDVMPRGLDTVPATMTLLTGVIVESLLILLATLVVMWRDSLENKSNSRVGPLTEPEELEKHQTNCADDPERNGGSSGEKKDRCGSGVKTIWVAPAKETLTPSLRPKYRGRSAICFSLTSQRLDWMFFVLTFVANSIFLCALFLG